MRKTITGCPVYVNVVTSSEAIAILQSGRADLEIYLLRSGNTPFLYPAVSAG